MIDSWTRALVLAPHTDDGQGTERVAGGPVGADAREHHVATGRAEPAEGPLKAQRQRGERAGILTPHLAQSRHSSRLSRGR